MHLIYALDASFSKDASMSDEPVQASRIDCLITKYD